MMDKKYFAISEVADILNIPAHKLRYLEKITKHMRIKKLRGRRYYTKENIERIKATLKSYQAFEPLPISRIDILLDKFNNLASISNN